MRIAVIGAGIGGLAVAAGLQGDGHEISVFERNRHASPTGAGLTLFGNAFAALDLLGLGDAVREISSDTIASMRAGQRHPSGNWLSTMPASAVATMRSVLRTELHQVLLARLGDGTVHWDCEAIAAGGGLPSVTVNGYGEDFDLVIAADGIRSRSRAILGLDTGLRYAGYTAWRGVTDRPVELDGSAGETWGNGRIFGIVPLADGRVYWFATLTTTPGADFPDDLGVVRRLFADWHAPVAECIDATPLESLMRHDIHDLAKPLPSFTRGRTVLLGDAAHAMTPSLGQGAGQALEDAATLTLMLRGAEVKELDQVLSRYSAVRRKRTSVILRRSRMAGKVAQASGALAVGLRNAVMRMTPGAVLGLMTENTAQWEFRNR